MYKDVLFEINIILFDNLAWHLFWVIKFEYTMGENRFAKNNNYV